MQISSPELQKLTKLWLFENCDFQAPHVTDKLAGTFGRIKK